MLFAIIKTTVAARVANSVNVSRAVISTANSNSHFACMCVIEERDSVKVDEVSGDTTKLSVSKSPSFTVRSLDL